MAERDVYLIGAGPFHDEVVGGLGELDFKVVEQDGMIDPPLSRLDSAIKKGAEIVIVSMALDKPVLGVTGRDVLGRLGSVNLRFTTYLFNDDPPVAIDGVNHMTGTAPDFFVAVVESEACTRKSRPVEKVRPNPYF